ncbi:pilus assembly protein PilP [Photorhabdus luminescens]|uniref:Pilus assembly protein PilP n=1 Tax=Photorhabdus akhurstii TaxID=171438 RepID=A0ABX8LY72_9GAMM|nr:type IV pilus biogenesis protein PilM [Photorhabdus akhurstii]QXF32685.1 pilus assembly protein PilP [Photorhabdus akhurstii]QXF35459.1 pilus assembly protein PilP [Photorhabdus akhurstii]UJD74481.1 pilus assembly protein PilP [Photorhabdus luminescens]UJD77290.1 pilus assembly protein PilP [Photorhabdus luminescens]
MGYVISGFALVFLLIAGGIQLRQAEQLHVDGDNARARILADQMLLLASAINHWRGGSSKNGTVDLRKLILPFQPDARIRHVISQDRLWVWMPEIPGLVTALRERTKGSMLIGEVRQGRLYGLSGQEIGLTLPDGISDGDVVYFN